MIHDYGKAISSYSLGNIYCLMHEFTNAKTSYLEMLEAAKNSKDMSLIAKAYLSLGEFEKEVGASETALHHLEKALAYISTSNYLGMNEYDKIQFESILLKSRINLCELYLNKSELDKALMNLLKLGKIIDTNKKLKTSYLSEFNYLYGVYFLEKELYNNAQNKFKEALKILKKIKSKNHEKINQQFVKVYDKLAEAYAKSGKNEEAYLALLEHNKYNNKFINDKRISYEAITKSKFLIEDYKNNVQLAEKEKALLVQKADKIQSTNFVITMVLILLAITVILLIRAYRAKRKLNKVLGEQNNILEYAKNEAIKSSELKSNFISNVTHELRTPLYGVVGITSLLLKNNNLSASDNKMLESLKYSGDYLLNLINEVLQFGKIESKKLELKNVTINLRELIKNNVNSFNYKLQETNNKIVTTIDDNVPKYIKCDGVRLSQVLINLIGNSIKFTESSYIYVRVKTLNLSNDSVRLHFEIQDEGKGIPKDKFNTIFEEFQQLDEESNTNYKGTGLGLSITKKIIELFGSEIVLQSEVGVGTTISFDLNLEIDNEKKSEEDAEEVVGKLVNLKQKHKILIAEDNKINQIVTKNLLIKQNYVCKVVENGLEAIKVIENENFDLILMDINMPIMNGVEATKIIREKDDNIPVIALTAADIDYVKENYNNIGFTGILTKPFDNNELFQMIQASIQNSKKYNNVLENVS
ncbi:hypothetical protein BWZ22_12835 [Seonamhaeicola sp. S2-3]|nr:hypothetical protein BWZ22_12835 [Seonamhaeicola sp. S2-3]